jgi:hypothetical protein
MSFSRLARREKENCRAVADDTLGASRAAAEPKISIVTGVSPYIPCMYLVYAVSCFIALCYALSYFIALFSLTN